MLYFYFDADSSQLYSKTDAPGATALRNTQNKDKTLPTGNKLLITNPITSELFLTLPEVNTNYLLQLFDINGKQMIITSGNPAYLQSTLRETVHLLSSGVYLLKVNGGSINKTQLINKL